MVFKNQILVAGLAAEGSRWVDEEGIGAPAEGVLCHVEGGIHKPGSVSGVVWRTAHSRHHGFGVAQRLPPIGEHLPALLRAKVQAPARVRPYRHAYDRLPRHVGCISRLGRPIDAAICAKGYGDGGYQTMIKARPNLPRCGKHRHARNSSRRTR